MVDYLLARDSFEKIRVCDHFLSEKALQGVLLRRQRYGSRIEYRKTDACHAGQVLDALSDCEVVVYLVGLVDTRSGPFHAIRLLGWPGYDHNLINEGGNTPSSTNK